MNHIESLTAYIAAFVDELARVDVRHAVISPGSRSTPLSMLMSKHPDMAVHMNIDERSAAFYALGLAKATRKPVALVCTSGTAAANYLPAVVEAHYSRVPLIVITSDRPHELREVGAPQAIDQTQLYGKYVKWSCDLALPDGRDTSIQYIRNISKRAFVTALQSPSGPVHLNAPIQEPLVPIMDRDFFDRGRSGQQGSFRFDDGKMIASDSVMDDLVNVVTKAKKGIIVCGEIHNRTFRESVLALSSALQYPILADPLSQLRSCSEDGVVETYDMFLRLEKIQEELRPEVIIRFGSMPVSKPLTLFIKKHKGIQQIVVDGGAGWREPTGMATQMVYSDESLFCEQLADRMSGKKKDHGWMDKWLAVNETTKKALLSIKEDDSMNEGRIFSELQELLPAGTNLFVGNSMPIRDCDTFFHCMDKSIKIYSNRGANGIDGVVSTALGVSAAGEPTVLVIGDLSFFHDMNGLLAARMLKRDMTIIIVNNDGGGIFSFLPQSSEKEFFEELFGTPHGLDFSHVIEMYGGRFSRVRDWQQFRHACEESLQETGLKVIEVMTERQSNVELHRKLAEKAAKELGRLLVSEQYVH